MPTLEIRESDTSVMPPDAALYLSRKDAESAAVKIGWRRRDVARWMRKYQPVWVIFNAVRVWTKTGFAVQFDIATSIGA